MKKLLFLNPETDSAKQREFRSSMVEQFKSTHAAFFLFGKEITDANIEYLLKDKAKKCVAIIFFKSGGEKIKVLQNYLTRKFRKKEFNDGMRTVSWEEKPLECPTLVITEKVPDEEVKKEQLQEA